MKYRFVIFDLDGTLTDPKEGITRCVQYGLKAVSIDEPSLEKLTCFIGPPLRVSFAERYGLDHDSTERAVAAYQKRFGEKGMFENTLYKGIPELLQALSEQGIVIALATSKPQPFTERILEHFDLAKYFTVAVGSELDGRRSDKAEVIAEVLERLGIKDEDKDSVVMVGDRSYDVLGAEKNGIRTIGAAYGYAPEGELGSCGAAAIAADTAELAEILLG